MEKPVEKPLTPEEKEKKRREHAIELIVVVMLGITALLTAWAGWIGSQHGGNQAALFAESNNLSALGNSMYNEGVQHMMQDMMLYNEIMFISIDMLFAEEQEDWLTYERLDWRLDQVINNASDEFLDAFDWSAEQEELRGESVSPFENEELMDYYFAEALDLLEEAEAVFEQGMEYSAHSDAFGLVTVFYTVALFLFGITSTFDLERNKIVIICIAGGSFLVASVYMMFLPMPTGFSLLNFFGG